MASTPTTDTGHQPDHSRLYSELRLLHSAIVAGFTDSAVEGLRIMYQEGAADRAELRRLMGELRYSELFHPAGSWWRDVAVWRLRRLMGTVADAALAEIVERGMRDAAVVCHRDIRTDSGELRGQSVTLIEGRATDG